MFRNTRPTLRNGFLVLAIAVPLAGCETPPPKDPNDPNSLNARVTTFNTQFAQQSAGSTGGGATTNTQSGLFAQKIVVTPQAQQGQATVGAVSATGGVATVGNTALVRAPTATTTGSPGPAQTTGTIQTSQTLVPGGNPGLVVLNPGGVGSAPQATIQGTSVQQSTSLSPTIAKPATGSTLSQLLGVGGGGISVDVPPAPLPTKATLLWCLSFSSCD